MTYQEAISTVDQLKPNTFDTELKVSWLDNLEERIRTQIINTHINSTETITGDKTNLIAPAPYDEMYLRWLEAMIDYNNGDYDRFNNATILFDNAYEGFKRYYTRTHMPVSAGTGFIY